MNASEEFLDTGAVMARIAEIRVVGPSTLEIDWAEGMRAGRRDVLDLTPLVGSYKVYRPLRGAPELFATARLIEDGDVVAWSGADLEMTAELIETLAEQAMTPEDFARFLVKNNLTHEAAAALLGRSRRQIEYYLARGPIPRVVALACFGYEAFAARQRSDAA
ncbi:MAG: hypothetical protein HYS06_10360 [Methylocystis sp.]|nr:hypothetical protein [Methylocystis sp.]MBI3274491.1 hypothetical protein [Methylocystis sp.]